MDQRWSHVPEQVADECEARQVPDDGRPVARIRHEDLVGDRGGQTCDGLRVPVEVLPDGNCFLPRYQTVTTVLAPPVTTVRPVGQTQVRISWWWNDVSETITGPCPSRAEPNESSGRRSPRRRSG